MKPVILYSFVLAALSSMALCGIAPSPGKGIRYACTNDCRNKQAGQSCGRGCTCTPNNKQKPALIKSLGDTAKMKPIILHLVLLAALSSMALCGLPPPLGARLNYACTYDCFRRRAGQSCGRNCTCIPHNIFTRSLLCMPLGLRPFHFDLYRG
ncbi:hypothetical protein MTO96_007899 [Rhipicephalus appendiculatus]